MVNSGTADIQPPQIPIFLGPAKWIWTREVFSSKEGWEHRRLVWFWSWPESWCNVPQWGQIQQFFLFDCCMNLFPVEEIKNISICSLPDHSGLCFPSLWRWAPQMCGGPVCAPGVNGSSGPAAAEFWCGAERVAGRSRDGDRRDDPHKERAVV